MVINKVEIVKKYLASLLLLLLLLPTIITFYHHFGEHEHIVCAENEAHIHQSIARCDVCDFNLLSFDFKIADFPDFKESIVDVKLNGTFKALQLNTFCPTNKQLRAPPFFS